MVIKENESWVFGFCESSESGAEWRAVTYKIREEDSRIGNIR